MMSEFNFAQPDLSSQLNMPNLGGYSDWNTNTNALSFNNPTPQMGTTATPPAGGGFFGNMSSYEKGLAGIQALQSILGAYNGIKANSLAKKQFSFQKNAWNTQWDAQRKTVNAQFEDRQKQRVARDPSALGVNEYMTKFGL